MVGIHPILELGDLVPEHRPIRIGRQKEEYIGDESTKKYTTVTVTLQAYVYGPRCPVIVKAALAQIAEKARKSAEANGGIFSDELFAEYARDSFIQLIPGLEFDEADILASDYKRSESVLQYLEYWKSDSRDEAIEEDPNLTGEDQPQTTQESSPISA